MRKNLLYLSVCAFILLSVSAGSVLAQNNLNSEKNDVLSKFEKQSIKDFSEKNALQLETNNLEIDLNSKEGVLLDSNGEEKSIEISESVINCNTANAYQVFELNTDDIIRDYDSNHKFSKYISNSYIWEIPICDKSGTIISTAAFRKGAKIKTIKQKNFNFKDKTSEKEFYERAAKREGKWHWIRTGNMIPCSEVEFVSNRDDISSYIRSLGLADIEEIKYVTLGIYRTEMIYVRAAGKDYGITFGARPDLTGLDNRTLYPIEEIMKTLETNFCK